MGATTSAPISAEAMLAALTGATPLPYDDERWDSLFEQTVPPGELQERGDYDDAQIGAKHVSTLLKSMQQFGSRFVVNNMSSGNLQRLLLHACASLIATSGALQREAGDPSMKQEVEESCQKLVTILFVSRVFLQCFIESMKQDILAVNLSGWPDDLDPELFGVPSLGRGVARALVRALTQFMVTARVTDVSYHAHEETLSMMLVLFSTQMFSSIDEPSLFLDMLMAEGEYFDATAVVRGLFKTVIARVPRKGQLYDPSKEQGLRVNFGGLLSRLAMYGSRLFLLPIRAIEWILETGSRNGVPVLANYAALLLGIIGNCRKTNPFTQAFTLFHDAQSLLPPEPLPAYAFELNLSQLVDSFATGLNHDAHILLFYFLIHRNEFVQKFVRSRTDMDALLLPLLRHLYEVGGKEAINAQQIYMMLIVLLILSQHDDFGVTCQRLMVAQVEWYKDQVIFDVSLLDVIALVLIRTVTLNLSKLQDGYLHTNCMAVLANLASSFSKLHAHTSQRLFGLLSFLRKRLTHVRAKLAARDAGIVKEEATDGSAIILMEGPMLLAEQDLDGMLTLYEQLMNILLEVMQAVVSHSLTSNTTFVYALLLARDDLVAISELARWAAMVEPLLKLLHHFDPLIQGQVSGVPRTMEDVIATIERGVMSLPIAPHVDGDLKFNYTEQDSAEQFFTPYVFSLVYLHSSASFNPARIHLFWLPQMQQQQEDQPPTDTSSSDPLGLVLDT